MEKKIYPKETLSSIIRFGNHIRHLRIVNQLTQDELAERMDVSTRNLSDLENGKINTSYATIYLLAKALNVSLSELFAFENEEK